MKVSGRSWAISALLPGENGWKVTFNKTRFHRANLPSPDGAFIKMICQRSKLQIVFYFFLEKFFSERLPVPLCVPVPPPFLRHALYPLHDVGVPSLAFFNGKKARLFVYYIYTICPPMTLLGLQQTPIIQFTRPPITCRLGGEREHTVEGE